MTILPLNPADNASPEALGAFLAECQARAQRDDRAKLVSISITVDALDPLAVLESIFEPDQPHFYLERPAAGLALAGAEAAVGYTAAGPDRFAAVQAFIDRTLVDTIAVGAVDAPFGGPHFFSAFTFAPEAGETEPFASAQVFVPRWQVACRDGRTTAVANLLVPPNTDLAALTDRVWRAHRKFTRFEYGVLQEPETLPEPPRLAPDEGDYRAAVAAAVRRIRAGEFQKIVLSRVLDVRSSRPLHPLRMLNGLRQRFPDCHAFSFANGQGDSFIGATPERLAGVAGRELRTEALAGTARRGTGAAEDAALGAALLRSPKDRHEQQLVLDSLHRRLKPLQLSLEHPTEPTLLRLANVQHLHTPVRAALPEGVRLLDAVACLHPTPAVGGSPREAALAALPDLERHARGLYAGTLGWVNGRGEGEFVVGIRSAWVRGTQARVYAGAGIVEGSDPDQEYLETELKFRALLEALLGRERP